jgi:hypothetical protein
MVVGLGLLTIPIFGGSAGCSAPADRTAASVIAADGPAVCGALDAIPVAGTFVSVACAGLDPLVVAALDAAAAAATPATAMTSSVTGASPVDAGVTEVRAIAASARKVAHVAIAAPAIDVGLPLSTATRVRAVCPGAVQLTHRGQPIAAWACSDNHRWRAQAILDALPVTTDLDAGR